MTRIALLLACLTLSPTLHAQVSPPTNAQLRATVEALQAENALLRHDIAMLAAGCPSPAAPAPRAGTTIDRKKFDDVYAAGKAVDAAWSASVPPRRFQQLLLAFGTEVSIVFDKTTDAERSLAKQYQMAQLKFELGAAQVDGRTSHYDGIETLKEASELLDAANKMYLGK